MIKTEDYYTKEVLKSFAKANGVDENYKPKARNKYDRFIRNRHNDIPITVDVYDVLEAFDVRNSALQHLIKKALCVGIRGHKDKSEDLQDIIDSAIRAKELEDGKFIKD